MISPPAMAARVRVSLCSTVLTMLFFEGKQLNLYAGEALRKLVLFINILEVIAFKIHEFNIVQLMANIFSNFIFRGRQGNWNKLNGQLCVMQLYCIKAHKRIWTQFYGQELRMAKKHEQGLSGITMILKAMKDKEDRTTIVYNLTEDVGKSKENDFFQSFWTSSELAKWLKNLQNQGPWQNLKA